MSPPLPPLPVSDSMTAGPHGSAPASGRPAPRGQYSATVAANVPLCREHFRLVLHLPSFPPTEPGQFVQLACRDLGRDPGCDPGRDLLTGPGADCEAEAERDWVEGRPPTLGGRELRVPLAFLRRPFSLAGRRQVAGPEGPRVELEVIHRVVGVGTDWLSRLAPGDTVPLLGPLGNRFPWPGDQGTALLVGGGVGIPPMLYLAQRLGERRQGRRAVAFAGALTRDLLPLTLAPGTLDPDTPAPAPDSAAPLFHVAEFARFGVPAVIATDDGSFGFRGFVTQALEAYLDKELAIQEGATSCPAGGSPTLYACGPEPMMKRVAAIAASRGLACLVAVERAMACGMGTCQSCCIRVRKPDPARPPLAGRDWCYRLACTDGPVFDAATLLW